MRPLSAIWERWRRGVSLNRELKRKKAPEVVRTPSRFRNPIAKYRIHRSNACTACGKCVEVCPYGVHEIRRGKVLTRNSYRCVGPDCPAPCHRNCPVQALVLKPNPTFQTMGDSRWTPDLLASAWYMAEYGKTPPGGLEHRIGGSGGGFDKLRIIMPPRRDDLPHREEDVDVGVELNRRQDHAHQVRIQVPFYGGGMSYGSVSITTMLSRIKAAALLGTFCCTGEGGYPDELKPYNDHVITQVATGLFGVREETIQRVRIVEFKYAQGAKPGLGGHLLGDKVTPGVARMREAVVGYPLFSPFPFHSVYSVEDHKKHVDWIKSINPRALVSVKVSTPTDVDMVAVGSYYAGAHIIHLDGSYGGTGAAPDIAKKNIAMPIEYAVPKVHRFLQQEGVRDKITVIASGGLRTPHDVAKIIALGADGVCTGTADLVALECIRCHNCESGRGCARGIATTDPELSNLIDLEWGTQRIVNLFLGWRAELVRILKRLGMKSIQELVGRRDCLVHLDYMK
ncbi:MAG: FMN-binding glutamate synthase family protein [Deltaproteobacteria bacterium HGW-Deltaproteobacteria-21]|nr:MAG: FMN-binding glutamate synthase family protein [Deltaproteobacteria bacterium HGW-Deltaproteobacteria-21]